MYPSSYIAFVGSLKSLAGASAFLAIILLFFSSHRAAASPDPASECTRYEQTNYNVNPQCTDEEYLARRARLNLPRIEQMHMQYHSTGDIILGFSEIKNGSGTALLVRLDSHERPLIEVRLRPRRSQRSGIVTVRARIGQDTWNNLVAKAHSLDFTDYSYEKICTAGGSWTVEVMDSEGFVRSIFHVPCYDNGALRYFTELANAALAVLPECASLHAEEFESAEDVLHRCLLPPRKQKVFRPRPKQ